MKLALSIVALAIAFIHVDAITPPKVQVYSRNPGTYDTPNTLICHVSGFHPPDINIELLRNGEPIPGAHQSDLAFEQSWQFHLTRSVEFKPTDGEQYSCRVKHGTEPHKNYNWESDM